MVIMTAEASVTRRQSRRFTSEQRDHAFRLVQETGNLFQVARDQGLMLGLEAQPDRAVGLTG